MGSERRDARVPGQVDPPAVGDHRRVGAGLVVEDLAAGLHVPALGRFVGELGRVDDVADRRERADHLAAGRPLPAGFAVLRVERVDVAVEGADVDGRRRGRRAGDGRARVDPVAGRVGPGERSVALLVAIDAAVVVARVDAAEGDRRGRVELARAAEPGPERAALPEQLAVRGADRVHVAAVVADIENAVAVGRRRLDRAAQRRRPAHVAVAGAEREQLAVFAAEVDGVAEDQRRGLGPPGQRVLPEDLPRPRVELDDVTGDEVDDVDAFVGVGGRGGAEPADPPFPQHMAVAGVEREGGAVVVDGVELAAREDRRILEQRALGVVPDQPERRLHTARRHVLGAGRVEAEHRPVDGLRLGRRRGRLLRHEMFDRRLVVDVSRPLQQLVADHDRGDPEHRSNDQPDRDPLVAPPELSRVQQEVGGAPDRGDHPGSMQRALKANLRQPPQPRTGPCRGHRLLPFSISGPLVRLR